MAPKIDILKNSIADRWGPRDWDVLYPWWRRPAKVRILMYADGLVRFAGGSFLGLQYVKALLASRAYSYVDFDISTAHRDADDPSATIRPAKLLTDLDILKNYDQIWFFGFNSAPNLSPDEVSLLDQFMAGPKYGGVLVTGDHADLGRAIAGQITRAGQMRQYPAPDSIYPIWNTTLEEGPDPGSTYDFDDQSDDRPQRIRYRLYPLFSGAVFRRRNRPHPVLCGPNGPIDILPDHQHEGEALAPPVAAGDPNWPTKNGFQPRPEVIAWGRIKDPDASRHGQEIGVISAYDGHAADVGRILADSTWHHWFDINLTGIAPSPSPYAGFDDTASGRDALKKIDAYFLNCGVWLAPPGKQQEMRNFGWWSILWTDRIVEASPDASIAYLGEQAIDALGRRASRCTVSGWVLDPIFKSKIPWWEWRMRFEKLELIDLPLERYLAGGALRRLLKEVGPHSERSLFPKDAPKDGALDRAIALGAQEGLKSLGGRLIEESSFAQKFSEDFVRIE